MTQPKLTNTPDQLRDVIRQRAAQGEHTAYVTLDEGETISRQYRVLSRAWYGPANLAAMRHSNHHLDEITIGHYSSGGGTTGEFCIAVRSFYPPIRSALELTIFDDAWHLLIYESELFRRIGELGAEFGNWATLSDVEKVLRECGFEDATQTNRPSA